MLTAGWGTVGVQEPGRIEPARAELGIILPNPLSGHATIRYLLPKQGNVELGVYDLAGKKVTTLASGLHKPGPQQVTWRRQDDQGRRLPAGVYFCRLETDETVQTRKVVVE